MSSNWPGVALALIKNALTPLANSILRQLGLTTAALATDAAMQKKTMYRCIKHVSGMTTLIISNEEVKDIMEISWKHLVIGKHDSR